MILSVIQHAIRNLAAAIDCGLTERRIGLSEYQAGDFLASAGAISREVEDAREMRAERARQVLVEREAEEEVSDGAMWRAAQSMFAKMNPTDSATATADPSPTVGRPVPRPSVRDEGPAGGDTPPSSPVGLPTFSKGVEAAANIVAEAAQKQWRDYLDSPILRPVVSQLDVARLLDSLTQQLRDHANEYAERSANDARITQRLSDAGFEQGRDYEPPLDQK